MKDISATPAVPPVVVSKGKISLADHLDLRNLPLATTPGGTNFCLKALHPSEHTIKAARVPGGNKLSVALCCDMVQTVPITTANTSVGVTLAPSILTPASVYIMPPGAGAPTAGVFYNAAWGGRYILGNTYVDTRNALSTLTGKISEYRITSQSATVELIAPALSDQGTITAAQWSSPPRTCSTYTASADTISAWSDLHVYHDVPDVSKLVLGSSAYTSKARDGCYMPLKINNFEWKNMNDPVVICQQGSNAFYNATIGIDARQSPRFPYHENRANIPANWNDYPRVPKMCGDNFGVIYVEGMAANVALRIRIRQVVEVTALPATTYAPLLEVALPPDPTALKMYMEISARMADAYPASYNDLGKLKDLVLGIGRKVLPYVEPALNVLSKVPGPVGAVASGAKTVATVGKALIGSKKAKKKKQV